MPRNIPEAKDLPQGWEVRIDPQGKPVYIDHVSNVTTYERPNAATIEENKTPTKDENSSQDKKPEHEPPPGMTAHTEVKYYRQWLLDLTPIDSAQ